MKIQKLKKMTCAEMLLLFAGVNTILMFLFCLIYPGRLSEVLLSDLNFSDYFYHIAFASEPTQTYAVGGGAACFPPLAYFFYYLLWRINPCYLADKGNWEGFRQADNNMLIFLMYNIVLTIALANLVQLYCEKIEGGGGGSDIVLF